MEKNGFLTMVMYIVLVFLCVGLAVLLYLNKGANDDLNEQIAEAEIAAQITPTPVPTATPTPTPEPERNTTGVTLAFGGDMVGQMGLTTEAKSVEESETESDSEDESESESSENAVYDYTAQLAPVAEYVQAADVSFCTLFGNLMDSQEYDSYLLSPTFAAALSQTGFDFVSTATNHCLDYGIDGVRSTISAITEQGMGNLGTFADEDSFNLSNGVSTKVINGTCFAFLNYTWETGGMSAVNDPYSVNILTTDYMTDQITVDYDRLSADLTKAQDMGADMIVCLISWSSNDSYYSDVREDQQAVVDYLCENGADVIIGNGLKVPQPMELRKVDLPDGTEKTCFIAYGLGNMLNCMNDQNTSVSGLLYLSFERDVDNGEVWLDSVNYRPLYMVDTDDYEDIEEDTALYKYRLFDIYDTVERFENVNNGLGEEGDDQRLVEDSITRDVYEAMLSGAETLQSIFGFDFDVKNGGVDVTEWAKNN